MSIEKRVTKSMLRISLAAILLLMALFLIGLFAIRSKTYTGLTEARETITEDNTEDMLAMSLQLAESTAQLNSSRINGDFSRIRGELETLKGDIENLYNSYGMTEYPGEVTRCEEYIVSKLAALTQKQIDETVQIMKGSTAMFDNVLAHEDKISLAYIVLENGMVFSSTDTFYPAVEAADMRTRDWYKNTVAAGTVTWAELYEGTDGRSYVTVAVPAYKHGTDEVLGVVAFDLRVSEISDIVLRNSESNYREAYIIGQDGMVLLSTRDPEETAEAADYKKFVSESDYTSKLNGCYSSDDLIAGFARISETDWTLVILLDYNQVLAPVEKVATTVSEVSKSMQDSISFLIRTVILLSIIFLMLLTVAVILVSRKIASRITNPIVVLSAGANEIGSGNIDYVIPDLGEDEIGSLAKTFNTMTARLREYIANLTAVTAEKERIGAELDVATHIQASMLPSINPKFSGKKEFRIFATMTPAKEVGGDFYDFFMVDDRHLAIVMADVSGKGVPAALFMVIGKTLIKDNTHPGRSLGDTFSEVNTLLCDANSEGLFITAFEGVLDLDTGDFEFVNAGHEFPFIKKKGQGFHFEKLRAGFVLAGMDGIKYRAGYMKLEPGDRLFEYTDGVTEATSTALELFGMDRLEASLNAHSEETPEELLVSVKRDIDTFVDGAPQFDDITMLCLDYLGN